MKKIYQIFIYLLVATSLLSMQNEPSELIVHNALLTKVNGKSISVLDLQKKMDQLFFQNYANLSDSIPARYEFYLSQWKNMLQEMVKTELIIADATDKKVQIKDGEIREELLKRYGPNIILNLNKNHLTYDEAWQMIKSELITMRMSWYFIHAKAIQAVSPKEIKAAYYRHLKENPSIETFRYQVVSVRSQEEAISQQLTNKLSKHLEKTSNSPQELKDELQEIAQPFTNCSLQISKEYDVTNISAASSLLSTLSDLKEKCYSKALSKKNGEKQEFVHRIFYLNQYEKKDPPTFDTLSNRIKNELLQKKSEEMAKGYIERLKKHYGYTDQVLVGDEFEPFQLR